MSQITVRQTREASPDPVVGIVRTFSDEMSAQEPNNDLTRALAVKVASDRRSEDHTAVLQNEWQRLFYDAGSLAPRTSHEQTLLRQSQKLTAAWERFIKKLPKEERINVRDKLPSLATLFNTVDQAQQKLNKKRDETVLGRFKGVFGSVCRSFDDYKDLFGMIPTDDKYICLLTGTLSTIVTATVNHEEIAEGVSDGLAGLCDDVFFWRRQLLEHQNEPLMQRYSIDLYVVVFDFLVDIFTNWSGGSSWDRFRHSFNRRYFEKLVESRRAKMDDLSRKLNREAELATQRATFETQKRITELATYDETEAMMSRLLNGMEMRLGRRMEKTLRESGRDQRIDMSRIALIQLPTGPEPKLIEGGSAAPTPAQDPMIAGVASTASESNSQEQFATFIASLQDFVQTKYIEDLIADASDITPNPKVYQALHSWASLRESPPLWIEGPFDVTTPSQNTLTAASLVYTARQSGASVLAHFCGTGPRASREEYYSKQLVALVYSLIAQLANFCKPEQLCGLDLSEQRLWKLDRSAKSLPEALSLFSELFDSRPQLLFVVVDSLHLVEDLDDKKQMSALREFLNIICRPRKGEDKRVTKVCLSSDGHVNVLGKMHDRRDIEAVSYEASDLDHVDDQGNRLGDLDF